MEKLKRYDLNCNIFDVYDYDGLSMQELLCQFYTKINECVEFSNSTLELCSWLVNEGLKEEVAEKLIQWLTDGTLEDIINVSLFENLNKKIDNVNSQLENIDNLFTYYIDKYKDLLTDDDWGIVLNNLISTIELGATIVFGPGTYNIKTTTVTNKKIRLVGQGALGTIINCTNNSTLIKFLGDKEEYNSLGGCGCSNMTINGEQLSTNPAIHYIYTAIGHNENLVINNFGGGALTFESSQDISLFKVYTRRCGNKDNDVASINLLKAKDSTTNQNCNEITFTECTFEHNTGRLVKSDFEYNNSISFNDCKFEYNNESEENLNEPIYINGGDRFSFNECRYSHYPTNGMFKLYNVTNSKITGKSFNNKNVTNFANIDSCINLEIDVIGRKTGKANITGPSYYINSKIHDRELLNYILTKEVPSNTIVNMNNFYYKDEGAKINNFEITGSGANKKIINILVSDDSFHSGITIYVHAKNSVSRQVKFTIRNSTRQDVFTKHIQVNTNYEWIKFSVPFEYCRTGEFSFYMANTVDDVTLSVDGIYYENRVTSQNEVPTFSGVKGDIVWNTFPNTGGVIGWVCNSTGVNWKGFGTIL